MQVFTPIYARKKGCPENRTPKFEGRGGTGVEALGSLGSLGSLEALEVVRDY
jgi:hypothetical protein